MIDAIDPRDRAPLTRVYTFERAKIDSVFFRVRPPLVMGVDTADGTEIMFRGAGVPLVERELVRTEHYFQVGQGHTYGRRAAPAAETAIAAVGIAEICPKRYDPQFHSAAMAPGASVLSVHRDFLVLATFGAALSGFGSGRACSWQSRVAAGHRGVARTLDHHAAKTMEMSARRRSRSRRHGPSRPHHRSGGPRPAR